jgi:hypothetical protein
VEIKNRQQVLLVAAIAILALFAGDKLLFTPMMSVWHERADRLERLRTQVRDGKTLLDRDTVLRDRWARMQGNTLTNNPSAAEQQFFRTLNTWAQNSGVTISGTTPQWKHDEDNYMTYQCRIDAAGDLSTLSRFLYQVERDPMAVKLESVELSAHDKEGRQLQLALQLSGLVLNSQTTR